MPAGLVKAQDRDKREQCPVCHWEWCRGARFAAGSSVFPTRTRQERPLTKPRVEICVAAVLWLAIWSCPALFETPHIILSSAFIDSARELILKPSFKFSVDLGETQGCKHGFGLVLVCVFQTHLYNLNSAI